MNNRKNPDVTLTCDCGCAESFVVDYSKRFKRFKNKKHEMKWRHENHPKAGRPVHQKRVGVKGERLAEGVMEIGFRNYHGKH